jgi:hypothetical protein
VQRRCPNCGAEVEIDGETVACRQCHQIFKASELLQAPLSSTLEYFGDRPAERAEGNAFASSAVMVAVEFVVGAVALGMTVGLTEPGPVLRKLGACGVFIGGAVGAVVGLIALTRRRLGYVDKSLALTTVAVGVLCVAAGVVIFTGWRS